MADYTLAQVAERLTDEQRAFILSMPDGRRDETSDQFWAIGIPLYVAMTPEQRCKETGFLLCPSDDWWFASGGACSPADSTEWTACWHKLNEQGLALRAYLEGLQG